MAKSNLEFLNDDLKYLGFGEGSLLNQHLEAQVLRNQPSFELFTETFYDADTKLETKLCFTRSKQSNFYFLNRYVALLRYAGDPEKDRAQTFYISKGRGITLKESYNLLQGRAIYKRLTTKDGEDYTTWLQLIFKVKDKNDNYVYHRVRPGDRSNQYNLEKSLEKYPIREMGLENTRMYLIRSLQRGNCQLVTFEQENKPEKAFIEANPSAKTINIYPTAMRAADKVVAGDGDEEPSGADWTGTEPVSHMMLEDEAQPEPNSKALS